MLEQQLMKITWVVHVCKHALSPSSLWLFCVSVHQLDIDKRIRNSARASTINNYKYVSNMSYCWYGNLTGGFQNIYIVHGIFQEITSPVDDNCLNHPLKIIDNVILILDFEKISNFNSLFKTAKHSIVSAK